MQDMNSIIKNNSSDRMMIQETQLADANNYRGLSVSLINLEVEFCTTSSLCGDTGCPLSKNIYGLCMY